jgi:hypothetical protein
MGRKIDIGGKFSLIFFIIIIVFMGQGFAAPVFWDGGGGDSLWNNPLNWNDDNVPGADDDVTIDLNVKVILSDFYGVANTVIIADGDTLKVRPDINLSIEDDIVINGELNLERSASLNLGRNWLRNGTFIIGTSTVTFNGTQNSEIQNPENFYNLSLNKGPGRQLFNRNATNYRITVQNNLDLFSGLFDVQDLAGVDVAVGGRVFIDASNAEGLDLTDFVVDGIQIEIGGDFINNSTNDRSFLDGDFSDLIFTG